MNLLLKSEVLPRNRCTVLSQYESFSTVVGERRCSRGLRLRSLLSLPEHDVMMCNTEYLTQPPLDK